MEQRDLKIIRELARQVADISSDSVMLQRIDHWKKHNALKTKKPTIAVFPEGSWREIIKLECEDETARAIERELRQRIFTYYINDDTVITNEFKVHKVITGLSGGIIDNIDWGVSVQHEDSKESYGFKPVILNFCDIKKLKVPTIEYNEQSTQQNYIHMQELLGDILNVKLCGIDHISFHIMYYYIHFRGYMQLLNDLYDAPQFVHELTDFLCEGYQSILRQCENLSLLDRNDDGTYQGSGGFGFMDGLNGKTPSAMWASAEAQELACVSPEQSEEFCISKERKLLEPFALSAYGCCEAIEDKLKYITSLKNLRRISVSPFADVEKCSEIIKDKYIFSWKVSPLLLSSDVFCKRDIVHYFEQYLPILSSNVVEIILADTHTCYGEPDRFLTFVKTVKELLT